jgi:uncharacterized protein (TIGR03435 family)
MKRRDKKVEEFVLRHMGLYKAPQEEMDDAEKRIQERLRATEWSVAEQPDPSLSRRRWRLNGLALAFGTTAVVLFVVFLLIPRGTDAEAAVLDGSLSRTLGEKIEIVRVGEKVEAGVVLQSNDGGSSIKVADSRVEMSEQSELLWERAEDGVRIRLNKGSVIVNAKPGTGRIYVQSKHALVFGAGSVFLVVAKEEGSHVAVIQGEVQVQQGASEKRLLAAEQMATDPAMETLRLAEALAWSRSAEAHLALLPAAPASRVQEERGAFEVISIRPSSPLPEPGGRGVPSGEASRPPVAAGREQTSARTITCGGSGSQLDVNPGRFVLTGATVYRLIVLAYGLKNCSLALQMELITNGPDWIKSDRFDVQASIPESSPVYTRQQLNGGEAAKLQQMIQKLLAERFKLSLRRESKDVTVYNLVVAKAGKAKLSEDQTPPEPPIRGQGFRAGALPRGVMLNCVGNAIVISSLANCLQRNVGGTIVDKTDLKGLYDIPSVTNPDPAAPTGQAALASLILEQMGLKLEQVKTSGEILVIESVERPTEN